MQLTRYTLKITTCDAVRWFKHGDFPHVRHFPDNIATKHIDGFPVAKCGRLVGVTVLSGHDIVTPGCWIVRNTIFGKPVFSVMEDVHFRESYIVPLANDQQEFPDDLEDK